MGKGGGGKGAWKRKKKKGGGKGKGDAEESDDGEGGGKRQRTAEDRMARNNIWREEGEWELKNESYEAYYERQQVCPKEEWPLLLQALRTGLPVAIRVNRMRAGSRALVERLEEMRSVCGADPARELYAPKQLTWYPHKLGWMWSGLERRAIKKDRKNAQLKAYLMHRERSGLISRQEAVSMIPPLFMSLEPHHLVLDLCAAPGSKTSQMLEIMHWVQCAEGGAPPSGLVLANELQWKRANMLAHQVQRLGSPCAAVVNIDAQFFPELWVKSKEGTPEPLRFDRVLCDVPCSGDGTMRKTPFIWRSWTLKDGLSLHVRQLGILNRGLDLLKVGGRLVYSTCSLNPMEDESVVAAALLRHGSALALLPPPELPPGMKTANGVDTWLVPNPEGGGVFFETYEEVPKEVREGKCKLLPSMFPPSLTGENSEAAKEIRQAIKSHCRRMLPHLMDTGGFFVAVLEKRAELRPSARARREAVSKEVKERQAQKKVDEAAPDGAAAAAAAAAPAAAAPPAAADADGADAPAPAGPPQGLKRLTREYVPAASQSSGVWEEIRDFYGFDEASASRFSTRDRTDQRVFLLSEGLERLLYSETRMPTRMVLCGVLALERSNSHHMRACPWRLVQEGLPALLGLGLKRRLSGTRAFLIRLIREKELTLAEVREEAAKGSVRGFEALGGDAAGCGDLRPGSLAVVLESEGPPLVLVASLSEDVLELAVGSASETAALLEDLEGQPSVEDILKVPDGDAAEDADVEEGEAGEAEGEASDAPPGAASASA